MIDRKTIDWFVDKLLEFQQSSIPHKQMHFEINGTGFVVMIWQRDDEEDGLHMWYYETNQETETFRHGGIMTIRDPYLIEARKHVEKLMEQARADWAEQLRAKGEMK